MLKYDFHKSKLEHRVIDMLNLRTCCYCPYCTYLSRIKRLYYFMEISENSRKG